MNCKQLIPGKQAKLTRVVACQGAVQLASAVAAMRTVDGQSTDDVEVENHLLVHDLSAPEGQIEEFARCIFELANKVESWKTQRFVPLADCVRLQSELARKNQRPLCLLSDYTGIENCDQLYVGQNNKFVPTWLRHSFSDAKHICFGDGIAVNFTNTYYRPKEYLSREAKQPWLKRARRGVKSAIKRILGMQSQQNSVEYSTDFDLHCLLLKNLFDQKLSNVTEINARHFMELFESFAEDFSSLAPVAHAELSQLRESPGTNVVLLTSNFSETGRMSLPGELLGYQRLLQSMHCGSQATLIIKPHPRDSYEKIDQLKKSIGTQYQQVIALEDPWTFYLPFESLYAAYLSPQVCPNRQTEVATVSSACLSLEYLYGQKCVQGFGSEIVKQEFVPLWSELRQIHETDLRNIVKNLRRQRTRMRSVANRAAA